MGITSVRWGASQTHMIGAILRCSHRFLSDRYNFICFFEDEEDSSTEMDIPDSTGPSSNL